MANVKATLHNKMRDIKAWGDREVIQSFCAEQLTLGRLALVLGAGVSLASGLPDWMKLMERCCRGVRRKVPSGLDSEKTAEWLLVNCCRSDDAVLAAKVRRALYDGYAATGVELAKVEMLTALAALSFPSARGGVYTIVTFNFDDLLEQLLGSFGVCVEAVWDVPAWESRADVRIYHPHGYLPLDGKASEHVVLAQKDFDRMHGGKWRPVLLDILRTHTCLFVGLSGNDQNLLGLMSFTKGEHVSRTDLHPYWGARIGGVKQANDFIWEERGVRPVNLGSYEEIPRFLRGISQAAAQRRWANAPAG